MGEECLKTVCRDDVLMAVRGAVEKADGRRVTLAQFLKSSGLKYEDVFRFFARWEEALEAAGYHFRRYNAWIETRLLLEDWGKVARHLQQLPTRADYKVHGEFSTRTLDTRCGGWIHIPAAFLEYAKKRIEWADLVELIPKLKRNSATQFHLRKREKLAVRNGRSPDAGSTAQERSTIRPANGRLWTPKQGPGRKKPLIYGERLGEGAMQYAPTNESGVIFLFGVMAEELGFVVEGMQTAFPDCEAKRRIGPGTWEKVRIEFEYESRNFRQHGHPAEDCDLIVCWEDNWPECPVEVIALQDFLGNEER